LLAGRIERVRHPVQNKISGARIAEFEFGARAQRPCGLVRGNRPLNRDINFFESTDGAGRISFQKPNHAKR
jgi:hypothetical protein